MNLIGSPTIERFVRSTAFVRILQGPRREGKSWGGYIDDLVFSEEIKPEHLPLRVAVVRDTWANLNRTTIETLREMAKAGLQVTWIDSDHEALVGGGRVHYLFMGMDTTKDFNKLQGFGAGRLWIEEPAPAADISGGVDATVFGLGVTSLSQPGVRLGVRITQNPPDEEHWTQHLKLRLLDLKRRPALRNLKMDVEVFDIPPGENPHVSQEQRDRNRAALEMAGRGDLVGRLVEGKVGTVLTGEPVTPEYEEAHVAPHPLPVLVQAEVIRGWDFGLYPTCCPAGTRVVLADGRVERIEALAPGMSVMAVYGDPPSVLAPAPVVHAGPTGYKRCVMIRTKHEEVRVSEDHPVLILRAVGGVGFGGSNRRELSWALAGELRRGDPVICHRQPMTTADAYTLASTGWAVSGDLAELIGVYLGDGSVMSRKDQPKALDLSAYDERLERRWADLATTVLGRPARRFRGRVIVGCADLARDFLDAGLGGKSTERRLPAWVFRLPVADRLRVLRGYLDSDGYVTPQGDVRMLAANEALIWDVWALCRSVGIRVQPVRRKLLTTKWTASGRREAWGFVSRDNAWLYIGSSKWEKRLAGRVRVERTRRLGPGLEVDQVVRVTKGELLEPVYDIEVAEAHTFVAQGLVTHNCVWCQATPSGYFHVLGCVRGENIGIEQLIDHHVKPWQVRFLGEDWQTRFRWRDIGDAAGRAKEQSNSEQSAVLTLQEMLDTTFENGPIAWDARRLPVKSLLGGPSIRGRRRVQIDPDPLSGAYIVKAALRGGAHYKKDGLGRIIETVESYKQASGVNSHPFDALAAVVGTLYPVEQVRAKPRVARPPRPMPQKLAWMAS